MSASSKPPPEDPMDKLRVSPIRAEKTRELGKGYNLDHNFGHGKINLSAVFVSLNLLAFAFHTVCDLAEELWREAMKKMGTCARFFENLRSITTFLVFPTDLLATLAFARPPPVAS
jgi:hypothetical protein